MERSEKSHTDRYKEITSDWNYNTSCPLTSLPVWALENFKHLVFVVQSVQLKCASIGEEHGIHENDCLLGCCAV
jgi:hypothetical protein